MNTNDINYTHGRTSVFRLDYHIVWATKYRHQVLSPAIEEELKQHFYRIAEEKEFTIREVAIGEDDHVHLFVTAPPKLSITTIVSCLKGTSAFRLFREHPELKQWYWAHGRHLWSPSYFVESIGDKNQDVLRRYIQKQRRREGYETDTTGKNDTTLPE